MVSQKKYPNFIWAIILSLIFLYGGSIIGEILTIPLYIVFLKIPLFFYNQNLLLLFLNLLTFATISSLVFFRVKVIERRSLSSIGLNKNNWLKKYLLGFFIGLVMMSIIVLILLSFGYITIEKNPIQPVGVSAISSVLVILFGWIIQGATEEIVTRGWLLNVLSNKYNIGVGLLISSTLFGLMHLSNPNVNYIAVINIILVGLFYGFYVIKTNDLWAVCGMHTAWNFAQGNLFGFEVSGIDVSVGSLIDLNLVGSDFVTGGIFGPEAGIVATFILLVSIGILLFIDKKGYFQVNL
ncbi:MULTISPECIES: CPBP family intramembrane glutamic endopeptidase [Romboutsia]|jgi:membrane protease YdiL (CAAX protease family)|uniref:CPBP family intramembrane glutamic endopeptidase n=1 Tax=Romboutsia TaxID=1501226 RepID=UPI00216DA7D3|nr:MULTISPECIES: type II CAAX endopeptidase family protein [Romboutsia]MCI9060855.1 CPBP family intramembrane metalloprotease [Romboutsia sp.]MCI9259768.1 CPBP family intramembrane metalloprotease [Romboutsia sp.]